MISFLWSIPIYGFLIWNLYFQWKNKSLFDFGYISFFIALYSLIAIIGLIGTILNYENFAFEWNRISILAVITDTFELCLPILIIKRIRESFAGFWYAWIFILLNYYPFQLWLYQTTVGKNQNISSWSAIRDSPWEFSIDAVGLLSFLLLSVPLAISSISRSDN